MKTALTLLIILFAGISSKNTLAGILTIGPDSFAIHSLGHASLMFEYDNIIIHVDPYGTQANYDLYPDADIILVTHAHADHYDASAISKIKTDSTILICTQEVKNKNTYTGTIYVLNNGDSMIVKGIPVKAVPAYNIVNASYHPKGVGNGYVVTLGEKQIYIAGDTENIPEMETLGKTDIAFIPMNQPYTMTAEMAADAAKKIMPDILYIYHYDNSFTGTLRNLLSDQHIEIRIGESVNYESAIREVEISGSIPYSETENIQMYPNPVADIFNLFISGKRAMVYIFNMQGQVLVNLKLTGKGNHVIDVGSLMDGVYVMKVDDYNGANTRQFIIEKQGRH